MSKGDLRQTTGIDSHDEVGRVARAFDEMTTTLDRTLSKLAEREAQAAMGEFAASLAHEVRNPLTAIRLDMQMVEEQLQALPDLREAQQRALDEIVRLDETVGRGLDTARKGQMGVRWVSIAVPLEAAVRAAAPAFAAAGAKLQAPVEAWPAAEIRGEPGSLEQLFLNILLNAAQALHVRRHGKGGSGFRGRTCGCQLSSTTVPASHLRSWNGSSSLSSRRIRMAPAWGCQLPDVSRPRTAGASRWTARPVAARS